MARGYKNLFRSDPYNGDISTKSTLRMAPSLVPLPDAARAWAAARHRDIDMEWDGAFNSSGEIIAAYLGYPDDLSFYRAQSLEGAGPVFVEQLEEFADVRWERDSISSSGDDDELLFQYFQKEDEFDWEESRNFFLTKYEEHS